MSKQKIIAAFIMVLFIASLQPAYSDDREIAGQKRAEAEELNRQADEIRDSVVAKRDALNNLKAEKEKTDKNISDLEREILPKKNEYSNLNAQYETKNKKYWQVNKPEINELQNHLERGENEPTTVTSRIGISMRSESSGPITEIKNGLNEAANGLDNIVSLLKQSGLNDEEISNLFQNVGVNPSRLSQELRQVSSEIPGGSMGLYELRQWNNKLTIEHARAKSDQARVRGSDYESLQQQVADYDRQIQHEEAQIRFWESEIARHEENARNAWQPCARWDIFGCIWNFPGLIHEKFLAPAANWANLVLGAQRKLNELKTMRGFPAARIALADAAALPYTFAVELLGRQMSAIENSIIKIKSDIQNRIQQLYDENVILKNEMSGIKEKMDRINADIAPIEEKTAPLRQKAKVLQDNIDKMNSEIGRLLSEAASLDGRAALLISEAEAIEASSPARSGEPCNPYIPMISQPGCIENSTAAARRSAWDGLPCPGENVPNYQTIGCIP